MRTTTTAPATATLSAIRIIWKREILRWWRDLFGTADAVEARQHRSIHVATDTSVPVSNRRRSLR